MPARPNPLLPALMLALPLAAGCAREPEAPPRPNVVLIVLDSLRADHLGAYGQERDTSPNIDRLAEHSLVFNHASSTAPWTNPAVGAMFTGHHPGALGVEGQSIRLPEGVPTLPMILAELGYQTFGVVSHIYVGEKLGFARGFDAWNQKNARGHRHVSSESVTRLALAQLEERDPARPFFLFTHYFDAHYNYLEHEGHVFSQAYDGRLTGSLTVDELRELAESGEMTDADRQHLRDVYDSEIHFADHHIGRLLDALEAQGLYDDCLIVLTADHGEALGEHDWIGHTRNLYQELLSAPLLVKLPGSRTQTLVDASVSTVDVLPTVLDHLRAAHEGVPSVEERSLLRVAEDRVAFGETLNHATLQSVTRGPWKLVHDTSSGAQALYDLRADPGETSDVSAREPEVLAELEAIRRGQAARNEALRRFLTVESPDYTAEELEQLRQLGYTR